MHRLFILFIACVLLLFSCANAESIDFNLYSDTELVELRNLIDLEISKRNEEKSNGLYKIEMEGCVVIIDHVSLVEYLEKPTLVLYCQFINYNNDAVRFDDVFGFSAFQDGIYIHETGSVDDENDSIDFIKSGATVEINRGFRIRDLSAPVEINIIGKISRIKRNNEPNTILETILLPIPN